MHDAGGGADLSVVVGVDVVHQEIDQTALFLEHREEADDFGIGSPCLRRHSYGAWRLSRSLRRARLLARLQESQDQNQNGQRRHRGFRQVGPDRLRNRHQSRAAHSRPESQAWQEPRPLSSRMPIPSAARKGNRIA